MVSFAKDSLAALSSINFYRDVALGRRTKGETCSYIFALVVLSALAMSAFNLHRVNQPLGTILNYHSVVEDIKSLFPKDLVIHCIPASPEKSFTVLINHPYPYAIPLPRVIGEEILKQDPISEIDAILDIATRPNISLVLFRDFPEHLQDASFYEFEIICREGRSLMVVMEQVLLVCPPSLILPQLASDSTTNEDNHPSLYHLSMLNSMAGGLVVNRNLTDSWVNSVADSVAVKLLLEYKLLIVLIDVAIFFVFLVVHALVSIGTIIGTGLALYIVAGLARLLLPTPAFSLGTTLQLIAYAHTITKILSIAPITQDLYPNHQSLVPIGVLIVLYLLFLHDKALLDYRTATTPRPPAPQPAPAATGQIAPPTAAAAAAAVGTGQVGTGATPTASDTQKSKPAK